MIRSKKAQITMFVILGLVLLIVFVIILAIVRNSTKPKTSAERIINELETGRIRNHIVSCMEAVAQDGLEKIGANGGVIYDFEGGNISFYGTKLGEDYLNYTSAQTLYYVRYGLKENTLCSKINYKIPDYPYSDVFFSDLNAIYNSACLYISFYSAFDGFFGQNTMPKLCYIAKESGCEGFAKGIEMGLTIQKQLEDYISKQLPSCINFSSFTSKMDVDITPEAKPITEVVIHDSDVLLILKYPLRISFEKQEPITRTMQYQTTLNVRLGRVYNFLYNLLSTDSKKIDFNLTSDFISSSYWRDGIELRKITAPCTLCSLPYQYDNLVEAIDRKSIVNGKPFVLRVVIKDRRPALDKITDLDIDLANTQSINLPLKAYDPDDSPITFIFMSLGPPGDAGWRENDATLKANLQIGYLSFPLIRSDIGEHEVGVLTLDDNGLFDYQFFWIKITDSSLNNLPDSICIDDCVLDACWDYAMNTPDCQAYCSTPPQCDPSTCSVSSFSTSTNPYYYCYNAWCQTAANACRSDCVGYVGKVCSQSNTKDCENCVFSVMNSAQRQVHVDCITLTDNKAACIDKMPNCFWVEENISNRFVESCYNDISLYLAHPPAYILTS